MAKLSITGLVAVAGTALALGTGDAAAQQFRVFFLEDFETVDLGDALDETVNDELDTNGDGINDFFTDQDGDGEADVWAGEPAFNLLGWTIDTPSDPNLPNQLNLGVEEWRQWALANSNWWAFDVDNQRRGEFANGFAGGSTVAVADPDEWDDIQAPFTDPVTGITTQESPENLTSWTSALTTPEIAIPAGKDEIQIDFSLSWRDEDAQDAQLVAQFTDGSGNAVGAPVVLMDVVSTPNTDPKFLNDFPNAQFSQLVADAPSDPTNIGPDVFPNGDLLQVPAGAAGIQLTFSVLNAGNDWWFAIDNLVLLAESAGGPIIAPGNFVINAQLINQTVTPSFTLTRAIEADSYQVEIADSADFSNIVTTISNIVPADPNDLTIDVQVPSGSLNSGEYYVRASATNVIGTTGSLNAPQFFVINDAVGDRDGDGDYDAFDIVDLAEPFGQITFGDIGAFLSAYQDATGP
jgi:hypothetical protein